MLRVLLLVFLCSGLCCWHRYQHIYTTLMMCLACFDLLFFLQLLNRQSGGMAWKQSEKNQCKNKPKLWEERGYTNIQQATKSFLCAYLRQEDVSTFMCLCTLLLHFFVKKKFFFLVKCNLQVFAETNPGSDLHNKELFSLIADSGYHQHCVSTDA